MSFRRKWIALGCLAVFGCSSAAEVETAPSGTLAVTSATQWQGLQEGCSVAELNESDLTLAEGRPEFLVAVDPLTQSPLCFETFDAIEMKLADSPSRVDALWVRYEASLQELGSSLGQLVPPQ